jgi:hypothetical protein
MSDLVRSGPILRPRQRVAHPVVQTVFRALFLLIGVLR